MNLVVAGLSSREEATFGFFLGRAKSQWTWKSAPAGRGLLLPKGDILVIDLVAFGLSQWTADAERELLRLVQDTPTVVLLSAHNRDWTAAERAPLKRHALFLLTKPYGTADMLVALEQAAESVSQRTLVTQSRLPTPVTTLAWSVPAQMPAATTASVVMGLSVAEFQARLAVLPEIVRPVFLRKLSEMFQTGRPFEARFTVQNSLIVQPVDGWIASNTPMQVVERVCLSDTMASVVGFREIDDAQAEERAQRLGMEVSELDLFLKNLVEASVDKASAN